MKTSVIERNEHGGTMRLGDGPLYYIYGNTQQYRLPGKYSGSQCTSMALAAIVHQKAFANITPVGINAILTEGHKLHTRLRDDIRLSTNPDKRVAIDDFPSKEYLPLGKIFGLDTSVRLRQECDYVFTSRMEGFEGFPTIDEYVAYWFLKRKKRRIGFLLTIGEYSHAVLMSEQGIVSLFDSHGELTYQGNAFKRLAGAVKFPSAAELTKFLTNNYGEGRHCAIALVCVHFPRHAHQPISRKADKKSVGTYKPLRLCASNTSVHWSLPDIQVDGVSLNATNKDRVVGASPYIHLLGGGG